MDELLAKAGLTTDDFINILSVEESPETGRIIIVVGPSLSTQPVDRVYRENFVLRLHLGEQNTYVFNPVV